MKLTRARMYWLALFAGSSFVLGFAPVNFFPLTFISLGVLFFLWLKAPTKKTSFWLGWLFGLGQFGVGVSWMYVSLNTFGNMPWLLAGLAVILLVMALALLPALVGYFQAFSHGQSAPLRLFFVITPLWLLAEWSRDWLFTGLPWLAAGYSQVENMLAFWAPLGGVYLVSLIVLLISCALLVFCYKKTLLALSVLIAIAAGTYLVSLQHWTQPDHRSLSVQLLQGNVSIWDKWNAAKTAEILEHYLSLSEQGEGVDLSIWPEAAAPLLLSELPQGFWSRLKENHHSHTMFGIIERDTASRGYYNAVATSGIEQGVSIYRKIHLVPFGEYLPFQALLEWLLRYLKIPMSDLSSYQAPQEPIDINGIKVGVSICYEDAFANVIRQALPSANVLVNVSEDAWFGDSLAPHQRLQMAQMRAIENGRTMVRVSNNGLSSIIDHTGQILALAPQFKSAIVNGQAESRVGLTPFSLWGHKLVLSLTLILLFIGLVNLLRGSQIYRRRTSALP